jgi:hypothetical protein
MNANGYALHMSNVAEGRKSTLIKPASIQGWKSTRLSPLGQREKSDDLLIVR